MADAVGYSRPYEEAAGGGATVAVEKTLEKCDFKALCQQLDDEFQTWRKDSILVFGANDR
jgi:hypothetical protein